MLALLGTSTVTTATVFRDNTVINSVQITNLKTIVNDRVLGQNPSTLPSGNRVDAIILGAGENGQGVLLMFLLPVSLQLGMSYL